MTKAGKNSDPFQDVQNFKAILNLTVLKFLPQSREVIRWSRSYLDW